MKQRTAQRIANAVYKTEALIPGVRGRIYPPGMDHTFKAWLWFDTSSGSIYWYWAVCEVHPNTNLTASPLYIAGRVWEFEKVPLEIPYQNWTPVIQDAIPESGYIILDLSADPVVFSFILDLEMEDGLLSDNIPIARVLVDGDSVKLEQIQYGDVLYTSSSSIAPVKLTSKISDTKYVGNVYEKGTDAAATETDVDIYVEEIAAGETLPFDVRLSANKQKWVGVNVWTLTEVPRLI